LNDLLSSLLSGHALPNLRTLTLHIRPAKPPSSQEFLDELLTVTIPGALRTLKSTSPKMHKVEIELPSLSGPGAEIFRQYLQHTTMLPSGVVGLNQMSVDIVEQSY
jgi:hypothetical protein